MSVLGRWRWLWPITLIFLTGYRFGMWVKNKDRGIARSVLLIPALLIAVASSVIYNWTVAALIFGLPRWGEWLFTQRLQRLYDDRVCLSGSAFVVVIEAVEILNRYDRDHIIKTRKVAK